MGAFFERMQKATRLYENNAPAYLRTHPLTSERIADMQNRAQMAVYKQAPDSIEFHLARAKVRAEQGLPREAVAHFNELVRDHRYAEEAGAATVWQALWQGRANFPARHPKSKRYAS